MCGFFAYYKLNDSTKFNKELFLESGKLISHRGPDNHRTFFSNDINMLFYRLSIIDTRNIANQPMLSLTKKSLIIFNGEIFNAHDLRADDNIKKYRTKSDTEVILNYYEKYGENCLKYFKGMFSFLIYDFSNKKCFVARDRFGIKPLYYSINNSYILFSSEIKPLLKYTSQNIININSFKKYLIFQKIETDETFFKKINSIKPSTYKIFTKKNIITKKYWNLISKKFNTNDSREIFLEFKNLLSKAIRRNLNSDRKVGISLSGGNDSLLISSELNNYDNITSVTYGFKNTDKNEFRQAEIIAKKFNFNHYNIFLEKNDILDNFENLVYQLESPFTSIRLFGMQKLFETFKNLNVPVVLEGSGGDEMLGGYDYNYVSYLKDTFEKKIFLKKLAMFSKYKKLDFKNYLIALENQHYVTKDCSVFFNKNFLKKNFSKENFNLKKKNIKINNLKQSQLVDIFNINLPRSLRYIDRLSMNHGVEVRPPLLDHDLFKYGFNLENKFKVKNDTTRLIMRKCLIEKKIIRNRKFFKSVIVDPQREYLHGHLSMYFNDIFNSKSFKENYLFNYKKIIQDFNNQKIIKKNSFYFFQILTTHLFMKKFKLI